MSKTRKKKDAPAEPSEDTASEGVVKPDSGTTEGPEAKEAEASRGRPGKRHLVRGAALLFVGLLACFLMMANTRQLPRGPLWGILAMLLAAGGFLDLLGLLRRPGTPWRETPLGPLSLNPLSLGAATPGTDASGGRREPLWMSPAVTVPAAALIFLFGALLGGSQLLPFVIALALGVLGLSALTRPAFLVFVVVGLLYLPFLGTFGLWDPWETHYGEVAREILARDDWISLWWAQDGWFWSKPILIFWTEALSLGVAGVDYLPDANPGHPEWAIRFPVAAFAMTAVMALYAAVSKVFSRRAGVLSALVLATMPHFFFLAHQAITDMLFVAPMTVAMSLLILALRVHPEERAKDIQLGPISVGLQQLVVAGLFLVIVPQCLYFITRNISLIPAADLATDTSFPFMFSWHGDRFMSGSAGNLGVPGNANPADQGPYVDWLQPGLQGLVWLVAFGGLVFLAVRERRTQGLLMVGFYVFCGLAFMGKGIPGFALPGMVALFYLVGSGRWSVLLEGRLRVAMGILTVITVGFPWYLAMFIRHGPPFTQRLLIHDHINRLAAGVHGDNGSIEYFIEQLGVGMFPWIALVPAALTMWIWSQRAQGSWGRGGSLDADGHRRETLILATLWFAGAFTLFSGMMTKFHHYIFPAEPGAALLIGVLLDRFFGAPARGSVGRRVLVTALAVLAPVPLALGFGGLWGDLGGWMPEDLTTPQREVWVFQNGMGTPAALGLLLLGAVLGSGAWWLLRSDRQGEDGDESPLESTGDWYGAFTVVLIAGTILVAFVARDLSWVTTSRPQGYERLIHLFVYNYERPWPEHLDFRPMLTGFGIAATVLFGVASVPPARRFASRALVGLAVTFAAWTLNVYMVELSPHWGQRELLKTYYEERESPDEPLVAWQMNWKGENFYSGNRVSVFVDLDNSAVREWIEEHEGQRAFFLLEHSRLGGFRGVLGGREVTEHTDKRLNNKFILVSAQL